MIIFVLAALATGLLGLYYVFHKRNLFQTTLRIPGPVVVNAKDGNLSEIQKAETFYTYVTGLHDQYGPIVGFYMGQQYVVSIGSAELFQQHSTLFDRPEFLFKPVEDLVTASSLQLTNGAEGKRRHAVYSHYFSGTAKFYPKFVECVMETCSGMLDASSRGERTSIREHMFALTSTVLSKCAFSDSFTKPELDELIAIYELWMSDTEKKFKGINTETAPADYNQRVREIVDGALGRRRANINPASKGSYIDILLNDPNIDAETQFADAIIMLIGGIHTTAFMLTWAIYFLAKQKDLQAKLADELREHQIADKETIEPADIEELLYTKQIINEALRHGVGPFAARVSEEQYQLGGFTIPPNTPVIQALSHVLLTEKYFPGAHRFDPDHFAPENVKGRHPFAFKPFGFSGNRMCPGNKFAIQEGMVALALLMARLDISLDGDQTAVPYYGFVIRPHDEIWITVKERTA